ncbi:MAG TPA: CAP domain-containing protein [Chloroflexota bacterium]|nr:CAP domain-containing protein [Chloroflexota bacterium]
MKRLGTSIALSLLAILALCSPSLAQTQPEFRLGFKALADQIPGTVGQPIEDEHYGPNGDSLQQTTTGLMVWRKADNWTAFTDGTTTWINGPSGMQSRENGARFAWEANDSSPTITLAARPAAPSAAAAPSAPAAPSVAILDASQFDAAVEDATLAMINASRAQFGVDLLAMDDGLRQVARAHAKDMGDRDYFAHNTPEGKSPFDMMAAAGIKFGRAAENIGYGTSLSNLDSVKPNHNYMMAETPPNDGHRVNILNAKLKKVGVGVYRTQDGRVLFVCDFTD